MSLLLLGGGAGFLHDSDERGFHFAGDLFSISATEKSEESGRLNGTEDGSAILSVGADATGQGAGDVNRSLQDGLSLLRIADLEHAALAVEGDALAHHLFFQIMRSENTEFMFSRDLRKSGTDLVQG